MSTPFPATSPKNITITRRSCRPFAKTSSRAFKSSNVSVHSPRNSSSMSGIRPSIAFHKPLQNLLRHGDRFFPDLFNEFLRVLEGKIAEMLVCVDAQDETVRIGLWMELRGVDVLPHADHLHGTR